jgi:hypothetical protein
VYRGPNLPNVPRYGAFYVGGLPNLSVYRRSWHLSQLTGSVISLSGESKFSAAELAAEPRHGDYTEFHEALSRIDKKECTSWLGTLWLSLVVLISAGLYISSSFVRRLAEPFIPQPGEGPAMEACERGWTRITNISAADVPDGADGDVPITVVTRYTAKGDPGYSHTAKILAEAALSVILPPLPGTTRPPLARVGGVLTPSTAGGAVLVERLRKFGVAQIESEIVDPDAEPKKTI